MRCLDSITDFNEQLHTIVEDRGAWCAVFHGVTKTCTWLSNWRATTWPRSRASEIFLVWFQTTIVKRTGNKESHTNFLVSQCIKTYVYTTLFSVLYILSKKCTYFNLKVFYRWKMLAVIWQPRVATNLQFAKIAASAKHNKMISACTCVCIY